MESLQFCSEPNAEVPIRNFRVVKPWLYRGGQPGADGVLALKELGVKTVVNLRQGRRSVEAERRHVEAAGMNFVNIPLSYWILPSEQTINSFLDLLDDEETHPVYVHCLHGKDRTGLLIAMYRLAKEGWPLDEAYREMKYCGFHRFSVRNFKWLLWRFARKHAESIGKA